MARSVAWCGPSLLVPAVPVRESHHVSAEAITLIVVAVLCWSVLDAIIKSLALSYPVPLLVWARYAVQALVILVWFGPRMPGRLVHTRQLPLQLARSVVLLLSSVCLVTAFRVLPLAEATAINYSTPTVVAALGVVLLHERMTRSRALSVVAGLIGMTLIVRPGAEMFQGASLFAVAAAGCYATFQILTRRLAREDSRVLLFYPALIGIVVMPLFVPWSSLTPAIPWQHVALITVGGLLGTLGHFLFILAMQRAPASAVTPFTYMQLVWATLIGWIAFSDFPDAMTVAGMGIIAASGLLLTWYEQRRRSAQRELDTVAPAVD